MAAVDLSFREIAVKRVTPTSFLSLILAEIVKLGILDACICKNIYIKEKLG